MEELKDLQKMSENAVARFNSYSGADFVLPSIFKEQVKSINSNTIIYNQYSAIIETAGNQNGILKIYMPNQWFYIASYFTEYYNELLKYKKVALEITTKERLKILNGNQLTDGEKQAINTLQCSDETKLNLIRFITDYSWWGGAKTIDRGDFYVSPILSLARLVNASQSFVADLCAFLSDKQNLVQAIIDGESGAENNIKEVTQTHSYTLQQIFYGAPGTGKSHTINEMTKGEDVIRTTFHPDTDYSSFVGAYKPATSLLPICNEIGEPMKIANQALYKEQIVYEFISQTFLQAYISAWKKYADTANGGPKKQFLVIEEINRGNCAQIFGDLFQLLDRNDYGFSEYPIKADADMKKQLKKVFNGLDIPQKDSINAMFEGRDVVTEVLDGDLLLLPNNLYIWATMNTSDQSLFPIDSAFKRRWDWTYIPISNANKGWTINTDDSHYDWWQFVERINDLIGRTTNSEDKKLGYFFCKAKDGEICAETFVGKVIFYLWNDVFKDYDFCDQVFNDANGNKLTFDKFYTAEGNNSKVVLENVELFLKNLKLEPVNDIVEQEEFVEQEADGHDLPINNQNKKDYTRYSINGEGNYPKKEVATELVKKYIGMNPSISADDVVENWKKLGISVSHFIETEAEYNARTDYDKRSNRIECNGSAVYVTWNGWGGTNRMKELKEAVSKQGWGLNIQEIMQ